MLIRRPIAMLFLVFVLAVAATPLLADATADLLGAVHIKNYIRLNVGPDPVDSTKTVILAATDSVSTDDLHPLAGRTFASDGTINVYVMEFNPLTQVWTVVGKASPDPNYGAIKTFIDDLKPLQATFPKPAEQVGGGGEDSPDPCTRLAALIQKAISSLKDSGIDGDHLKTIATEAVGSKGVLKAKKDLEDVIGKIDADNATASATLQQIRLLFGTSNGVAPLLSCSTIASPMLVDYVDATGRAQQVIDRRKALADALRNLIKTSLAPYTDPKRWRGADSSDLLFTSITPTFENLMTVDAAMKAKTLDVSGNSISVTTADTGSTAQFVVRRDSFLIPERAAAVIYNHLTYPKYGTTVKDGKTVVERVKDAEPVSGAIMLNLIPRFGRTSAVYPMLQVGVSSAKEFPGFLAGVGLRFTAPVAFSLSAGGIVTRFKDLDQSLHVGDVVTGTSDIDKHLQYRTSPVALYAAMQMKF